MSPRYQRGSLRREKRGGKSDLWAWRYRLTGTMKQETYPVILGGHPKAATYDQFKTGHSEGLRHTH